MPFIMITVIINQCHYWVWGIEKEKGNDGYWSEVKHFAFKQDSSSCRRVFFTLTKHWLDKGILSKSTTSRHKKRQTSPLAPIQSALACLYWVGLSTCFYAEELQPACESRRVYCLTCFFDEKNLFTCLCSYYKFCLLQHGETYICFLRGI